LPQHQQIYKKGTPWKYSQIVPLLSKMSANGVRELKKLFCGYERKKTVGSVAKYSSKALIKI
jgi:hypothetical protein